MTRFDRRKFGKLVVRSGVAASLASALRRIPAPSASAGSGPGGAFDHVVVVMFENRSFDNLLGRLYQPGEVESFEGVLGGSPLSNPIPDWAEDGAGQGSVPYGVATNMNTPNPDPGEEYPHLNTQLFGIIDPPGNRSKDLKDIVAPFNAPPRHQRATMDGFVSDYISAFTAEMKRQPTYAEYAQIMTGYTPEQMPVISALARGFATFDHWFCAVPSQTFTNRSFFHAATASGYVVNSSPADSFPVHNTAETLFERLESQGLTWNVYCSPPSPLSYTGLIHASRLKKRFATNFFTTDQFLDDAQQGNLPTYSFIEPNMLHGHNDMHPPFSALTPGLHFDPPSSLLGGEALLAKIYNAIRSSSSPTGSNYLNTLLLVVFDEAGGTYDHVPPPPAPPPDPSAPAGQMGFTFNRLGIRVPAIAISPWIPSGTVVNEHYRHTSLLRTMRERFCLGQAFTDRDAAARDIAPVLSLDTPRPPEEWPDVFPQPVPAFDESLVPPDAPLGVLARAAFFGVLAMAKDFGQTVPDIPQDTDIKGAAALEIVKEVLGDLFPGLKS